MSENTKDTKPGTSDHADDDEEQSGEFVNEITPTNMPEPVDDPSWTHGDDDKGGETDKPDANS